MPCAGSSTPDSLTARRSSPRTTRLALWVAISTAVLAAAIVRVYAARDEFWFDEIWSLVAFARRADSPLNVFFNFPHDNNHHLITLWMYLVGPWRQDWFIYRVPSLIAGVGTVVLAVRATWRWGPFAALAAALGTGSSYVLIVYASEARGYALAGFFALLAFLALDRWLETGRAKAAALFATACVLGILSHLTFVEFYLGALVWSVVATRRRSTGWNELLLRLAKCHAVPLAFMAAFFLACTRGIWIGGGGANPLGVVVLKAVTLSIGSFASTNAVTIVAAVVAIMAAIAAVALLWNEKSDLWVFFAVTVFIAPALLLAIGRPASVYERYFYVNILFALLLYCYLLSRVFARGTIGRYAAALLLLAFILGNAKLTFDFLKAGRGSCREALAYVAEHSTETDLLIGGHDDMFNQIYFDFYSKYLPSGVRVRYFDIHRAWPSTPNWIVLPGQEQNPVVPLTIRSPDRTTTYSLARFFPFRGLSGYHFGVYQRDVHPAGGTVGAPGSAPTR